MDLLKLAPVAALLALAGCFDPTELDGTLRCGAGGACPSGFACGADQLCWRPPSVDGDVSPDAPDAPPPPPECDNAIDDDCDGLVDDSDTGCASSSDPSEHGSKRCDNAIDDDSDGYIDYRLEDCGPPGDSDCDKADDDSE